MPGITKTQLVRLKRLIAEGNEAAFYSWPEWEETRRKVLALDRHECTRCKARGRYSPAVLVHHVYHLKDSPELALSVYDANGRR